MSLMSAIPIVRADITLTSEFEEPVKNWSFEDRDPDIPGDGVYRCPPWDTNNGGWRDVPGDVEGNGKCNSIDLNLLAAAYGSKPEDPNWNPNCDIDGDGRVGSTDLFILAADYGKTAHRIDGSYSWYTSGGGDYQMWQWLGDDAINDVKGKQVAFTFWFLPELIPSGSESEPLGQATSTSGWYCGTELSYTPPSDKTVILRKVQLDVYVDDGSGYYKITYQKAGEAETLLVSDQEVTNTVQETRTHDVFVGSGEGQAITVRFYIGRYEGSGMIWSRNHYMYYQVPVPARAEIYYEYSSGSNTVYGDWIHPNKTKWYSAFVTAAIPSSANLVKVVIHGKPDFKVYVDLASFSICSYATASSDEGNLALAVNLFRWEIKDVEPGFPDGLALVSVGLYAERAEDYRIRKIQLKVELLPNDGSSSTQQGGLQIWYCGQANDDGYEVDPAAVEEFQNQVFSSSELAIKVIAGAIVGMFTRYPYSLLVSTFVGTAVHYILQHFCSDPQDPTANAHLDPTDYFILERWDYPDLGGPPNSFVDSATGHYGFEWQFHTESASDFQIRVTASVNWGWPWYDPESSCWFLVDVGWTDVYTTITINA